MKKLAATLLLAVLSLSPLAAQNRAIQIREVNLATSVLELHNFGNVDISLNGWRFCSHDEDQDRRYSGSSGLNGRTLAVGESLFFHFLNDAPAGDATAINISSLGGSFALPLDRGPYAIEIYLRSPFGIAANIADHLQWNIDGIDNTRADFRSDLAVNAGTWTDANAWINTTPESLTINLTDTTGAALHGPANFVVAEPLPFPESLAITNIEVSSIGDVSLSWEDLSSFGTIDYIIETSTDLTPDSWEPVFTDPIQETSTVITGLGDGPQFFRVVASPPSSAS